MVSSTGDGRGVKIARLWTDNIVCMLTEWTIDCGFESALLKGFRSLNVNYFGEYRRVLPHGIVAFVSTLVIVVFLINFNIP